MFVASNRRAHHIFICCRLLLLFLAEGVFAGGYHGVRRLFYRRVAPHRGVVLGPSSSREVLEALNGRPALLTLEKSWCDASVSSRHARRASTNIGFLDSEAPVQNHRITTSSAFGLHF
jgi:hypothetical protein